MSVGSGSHWIGDPNWLAHDNILSRATYHRAPRYGGMRTRMEGLLARGNHTLAEASNLMGYKNAQQDLS